MDIIIRKVKEQFLVIIFVAVVVFVFYTMFSFKAESSRTPSVPTVTIGDTTVTVLVADEEKERIQGLSGVEVLPPDQGMLFIYDLPSYYTFWMKGMLFPLDFIWINNGEVVDISKNIPNPSYENEEPQTITPNTPALMILEVPAGFIEKNNIRIGDPVIYTP